MGPNCDQVGTKWDQVGTKWDQSGTKWDQMRTKWDQVGTKWHQVGTKRGQVGTNSKNVDFSLDLKGFVERNDGTRLAYLAPVPRGRGASPSLSVSPISPETSDALE